MAAFTTVELDALTERAKKSPRIRRKLYRYIRNVTRIRTLERVLDPEDTTAVGDLSSGNVASWQAEIDRRAAELPALETTLRAALPTEEVSDGQ